MKVLVPVLVLLAVAILGVHSADKSPPPPAAELSDNVASATVTTAKTVAKPAKRSNADEEQITAQETQHQYDDRHVPPHHHQRQHQPQQLISQGEYLALIRESQRAAAQEGSSSPQSYGKLSASPERVESSFYDRNPGHPLAGSSLEKEIEKLVSANAQQYAQEQQQHISAPQHESSQSISSPVQQQFTRPPHYPQQQLLRSPVVFKNQNDVVYIPYQEQQVPREQYPRQGITKAKVQLINAYSPHRAPFPSEAIEYGPAHQAPPQFAPVKSHESFKELYIQQQRENHLKRLQAQQQHLASQDNLNLQSHSQPLSISLLPKKQTQQPQPSQIVAEQTADSNFAQFAERLFKTPLDQQKPLSQEQFKALVAAGYPVQAVPVPISAAKQGTASYSQQVPQRYAPASVSLGHPQPFMHPSKQLTQAVHYSQQQPGPQTHRHSAPPSPPHHHPHHQHHHAIQNHQQSQEQQQIHRYPQGQYAQPQSHTTYQVPAAGPPQHGPYTYVLQPGENEESAAEQLRQQIIHEINAQSQKAAAGSSSNGAHQAASNGFTPMRAPQSSAAQGQTLVTADKPLTEEQKEYYKRLDYYSHNQQ